LALGKQDAVSPGKKRAPREEALLAEQRLEKREGEARMAVRSHNGRRGGHEGPQQEALSEAQRVPSRGRLPEPRAQQKKAAAGILVAKNWIARLRPGGFAGAGKPRGGAPPASKQHHRVDAAAKKVCERFCLFNSSATALAATGIAGGSLPSPAG
jgi:hypothetical protein